MSELATHQEGTHVQAYHKVKTNTRLHIAPSEKHCSMRESTGRVRRTPTAKHTNYTTPYTPSKYKANGPKKPDLNKDLVPDHLDCIRLHPFSRVDKEDVVVADELVVLPHIVHRGAVVLTVKHLFNHRRCKR